MVGVPHRPLLPSLPTAEAEAARTQGAAAPSAPPLQQVVSPATRAPVTRRPPVTQIKCVLLLFCTTKSIFVRKSEQKYF